MLPYIDKQAELLNILIDIYTEINDQEKCRRLIEEIDRINERYSDMGIFREVSEEKRKNAGL